MNNAGNEVLRKILEYGIAEEKATDNYSKNYILFQNLFDKLSMEKPLIIYQFILHLLDKTILLPIQADNQDTALNIFSTLNDRGLPLSDADILKRKYIINYQKKKSKNLSINGKNWMNGLAV